MRRRWSALFSGALGILLLAFVPAPGFAQSGIAGVVKDASGAVLPGVTVEAASPALIEKVRTVVTDGEGQYKLLDIRPGIYTVTFSLPGFSTVKRDGLELPASFTATVNAELKVGTLEETVTVSAESPIVDVQNSVQQRTLSKDMMDAIPTARLPQSYTAFVPAVVSDVSTAAATGPSTNALVVHGSRIFEAQVAIDGFSNRNINNSGGSGFFYYPNQAMTQEVTIVLGSSGSEQQMSGVVTNVIPREGSNRWSGSMYGAYNNENFQGNNVTDALKAQEVSLSGLKQQWDYNPAGGGPIFKDKLWFYGSYRNWGVTQFVAGSYYNATPTAWVYTPDLARPATGEVSNDSEAIRLTWQASPKNKVSAFFDLSPFTHHNRGFAATLAPEAQTWSPIVPNNFAQVTWKSPVTSRMLVEAGVVYQNGNLYQYPETGNDELYKGSATWDPNAVSARELSTGTTFRSAPLLGLQFGSQNYKVRGAVSYVTGSHAFKVGIDQFGGTRTAYALHNGDYTVSLQNGLPRSMTLFAPTNYRIRLNADMGLYGQDQWTIGRATLNLGLRYDYLNSGNLATDVPANRWVPARHFDAVNPVVVWHDLSPRLGVSFDLFGNGKTAVKLGLGRYVQGQSIQLAEANNPITTSVLSATRTWNDSIFGAGDPRSGNFLPDCDFSNSAINGECGVLSNLNFGQNNPRATTFDPAMLRGYGARGYSWEGSVTVQHEILTGVSINGGYFRRWYGNFAFASGNLASAGAYTDNLLVTPADYSPYCITVQKDSRLPGGGGNQLCGFYDVSLAKVGQSQLYATFASNYGDLYERYNGVDFSVNARLPAGVQLNAGTSTGRSEINNCFVIDNPGTYIPPTSPYTSMTPEFCDSKPPFLTQFKATAIYPVPWWGLQVSGAYIDVPGADYSATTYVATNAEVAPTLGRNLSAGATGTVTLPLMPAGALYGPRARRIDLRFSKTVKLGQARLSPSLDVFNLLNANAPTAVNLSYGPKWLFPTTIQDPRMFRIAVQLDF